MTDSKNRTSKKGLESTVLKHQDILDLKKQIESLDSPRFNAIVFSKGLEIAAFYIRSGYIKFLDFSHKMLEDVGMCVKPFLKSLYNGLRYCPGMENYMPEMSSLVFVDSIDVNPIHLEDKLYKHIWCFTYGSWHATEYIEKGYYSIESIARLMVQDFGDIIRPEIVTCYDLARGWYKSHGQNDVIARMDSKETVEGFNANTFDLIKSLKKRYYAPKDPRFLTISTHPGILTSSDIKKNLVLMEMMGEQFEMDGEVDVINALASLEEIESDNLCERMNMAASYFHNPEWEQTWKRMNLYPDTAKTWEESNEIELFPIEEAFAKEEEGLLSRKEAESRLIEMLENRFLERFWEPVPEWDHTGPEEIAPDLNQTENEQKQSKNYLRNKYKSFEEGLAAYLKWEEGYLEPYERPATEDDIERWTELFKQLWNREELSERRN